MILRFSEVWRTELPHPSLVSLPRTLSECRGALDRVQMVTRKGDETMCPAESHFIRRPRRLLASVTGGRRSLMTRSMRGRRSAYLGSSGRHMLDHDARRPSRTLSRRDGSRPSIAGPPHGDVRDPQPGVRASIADTLAMSAARKGEQLAELGFGAASGRPDDLEELFSVASGADPFCRRPLQALKTRATAARSFPLSGLISRTSAARQAKTRRP